MATDPEIRDGFTLPVWMKTKPTKDFDAFAASPPAPEDSFFYIKYPKTDILYPKTSKVDQDIQKVLQEPKIVSAASYGVTEKDWSKHTKPCQEVLHGISSVPNFANLNSNANKVASDDEFKEEASACGTSVVKVANQMIRSPRGFTLASPEEDEVMTSPPAYRSHRRGSRSLPASPAHSPPGSPNTRRKVGNRYFTSPFEPAESSSRSWLSAALLAYKKDLSSSTSTLHEEDSLQARLQGTTLAESVECLGPSPHRVSTFNQAEPPKEPAPSKKATKPTYRPRPTELREMNFWSPTSM